MDFAHQSVLLDEVIAGLNLKPQGVYVDCTLGGGGHTLALLQAQPDCTVIGIDQDPRRWRQLNKGWLSLVPSEICPG